MADITDFNPRLREGGDEQNKVELLAARNFNPRLREGGDDKWTEQELQKLISIHASTKEATYIRNYRSVLQ